MAPKKAGGSNKPRGNATEEVEETLQAVVGGSRANADAMPQNALYRMLMFLVGLGACGHL